MFLNKKTSLELEKFKKLPAKRLIKIRRELDESLFENKVYLTGLNKPVPVQFNCPILTAQQKKDFFYKSEIVFGAIKKVAEEYYKSGALRKKLSIDPFEEELFLKAGRPQGFGVMRIDGFLEKGKIKFVELNSDYPDAIVLAQNSCDVYRKIMKKYGLFNSEKFENVDNKNLFYKNLLNIYKFNGGKKKRPTIAVVAPKGRAGDNEYQEMVKYLEKKGHKSFHVEPKDLKQDKKGFLFYRKEKIDIVRRAAEIRYFKNSKEGEKIFDAYIKNRAIFINSFHDRLLGIKNILAVLHEDRYQYLFSPKEKEVIKEAVPKTFILKPERNNLEDMDFWKNKDNFVIKPPDLSEAEDVAFGKDFNLKDWRKILVSSQKKNWTIQELIEVERREVLKIEGEKKKVEKLYSDFSIHMFMDKNKKLRFGTILNRTSQSPIVNVSCGGGINSIFILKK